jgi:hypothetical protein
VLLFAYITLHLSVIIACIKAMQDGGIVQGLVMIIFGPIYALAVPILLVSALKAEGAERNIAKWTEENSQDPRDTDARTEAIEALVAEQVGYGDQRSMNAALYSLVAPFEQSFSKLKLIMMLEKVLLGTFVVGTQGDTQIWGSLSISVVGTVFYMWKQPMLDSGEDFTESISRLSNTIVVLTGTLAQHNTISKAAGEGILMTVSTATMCMFVVTLGPRRVVTSLGAYGRKQAALHTSAMMSEEFIQNTMTDDEVLEFDDTMWANLSADQQVWFMQFHGSKIIESQMTVVQVGTLSLPTRTVYKSSTLDISGQVDSATLAPFMAAWLTSAAAAELRCLIIGPKSTRLPVNDGQVTELTFKQQEFSAGEAALVTIATSTLPAIARVDLRSNGLSDDALVELRELADFTAGQVFVWVREGKIDLSSAGLTADDITSLATFLATPAGAALTEVDVRSNKGLDEVAVAALRAAAPETCKILADY